MAKLSAKARKSMPKGDFAGPGKSFPVNDPNHAKLAIGGATRSYNAGNIGKATEDKIKSEARGKLNDAHNNHSGMAGHPGKNSEHTVGGKPGHHNYK